jgi:hypothetical protein
MEKGKRRLTAFIPRLKTLANSSLRGLPVVFPVINSQLEPVLNVQLSPVLNVQKSPVLKSQQEPV